MDLRQMQANVAKASLLLGAMSNERRLHVLCQLLDGEKTVGELLTRVGGSQSSLSQHLARLRRDKLVKTRRRAQMISYSLSGLEVVALIRTLHRLYCDGSGSLETGCPVKERSEHTDNPIVVDAPSPAVLQEPRRRPLEEASPEQLDGIRLLLVDLDDIVTGTLPGAMFDALDRMRRAGLRVVAVTAESAGWCHHIASMWPIDAVVAEQGGVWLSRMADGHVAQRFWPKMASPAHQTRPLGRLQRRVRATMPAVAIAADQKFRLASAAFELSGEFVERDEMLKQCRVEGAQAVVRGRRVVAWFGDYDKLAASRRLITDVFGIVGETLDDILYIGHDAALVAGLPQSVGLGTDCPTTSLWMTSNSGEQGFVEAVDRLLAIRSSPP